MTWAYPYSIVNGDSRDASKLQGLLDYARRRVNAITDGEMTGITEGGLPPRINFDPVGGHDHDGVGETAIVPANRVTAIQGSVKVFSGVVDIAAISWSTDLVTGSGLTKVIGVWVGAIAGAVDRYATAASINADVNDGSYYVVVNPAGATDEVFIFNGIGSTTSYTAAGLDLSYYFIMVGT